MPDIGRTMGGPYQARQARWPHGPVEIAPAFSPLTTPARPLSGTLAPERVPDPPDRWRPGPRETAALIAIAAIAAIAAGAIPLLASALRHGWFG